MNFTESDLDQEIAKYMEDNFFAVVFGMPRFSLKMNDFKCLADEVLSSFSVLKKCHFPSGSVNRKRTRFLDQRDRKSITARMRLI